MLVLVKDPDEPRLAKLELLELLELELLVLELLEALEAELLKLELELLEAGVEEVGPVSELVGRPVTSTKRVVATVVDFSVMKATDFDIGMIVMRFGSVEVADLVVFSNLLCNLKLY